MERRIRPQAAASKSSSVPSEKYIQNLKGAVYLLTVENEMLKGNSSSTSGSPAHARASLEPRQGAPMPTGPMDMRASSGSNVYAQGIMSGIPFGPTGMGPPPHQLSDLEALMRSKYIGQATGYEHQINELKKAQDALAQQNAAQSSLIGALQTELASAHDLITRHDDVLQSSMIQSSVQLERAGVEAESLRSTIARLEKEISSLKASLDREVAAGAELRSKLAAEQEANAAGEAVRLEAAAKLAKAVSTQQAAEAAVDKVRAARDAAEADAAAVSAMFYLWQQTFVRVGRCSITTTAHSLPTFPSLSPCLSACLQVRKERYAAKERATASEQAAILARAAAAEATAARDGALAQVQELRVRVEELQRSNHALRAENEGAEASVRQLGERAQELATQLEAAAHTTALAVREKEAALARAGQLESELALRTSEANRLTYVATEAGTHATDCEIRMRQAQDALAQVKGTTGALQRAAAEASRRADAAETALEKERSARIALDAEVTLLREELSRRPPLDSLRQLEIDSLLQRNMEAAAALQSLLEYSRGPRSGPEYGVDFVHGSASARGSRGTGGGGGASSGDGGGPLNTSRTAASDALVPTNRPPFPLSGASSVSEVPADGLNSTGTARSGR